MQERLDRLNSVMQENLAGVRVVKAFARADHEIRRFAGANDNLTDQSISAARTVAIMPSFMMLTMNLGVVGVLWFGGVQVTRGGMQVGQIIAFVNYLMTTLLSLMMVSQMVMRFARAEASARRIQEVLESQPEVQDAPDAAPRPDPARAGGLRKRDLWLRRRAQRAGAQGGQLQRRARRRRWPCWAPPAQARPAWST